MTTKIGDIKPQQDAAGTPWKNPSWSFSARLRRPAAV